MDYSKQFHCRD